MSWGKLWGGTLAVSRFGQIGIRIHLFYKTDLQAHSSLDLAWAWKEPGVLESHSPPTFVNLVRELQISAHRHSGWGLRRVPDGRSAHMVALGERSERCGLPPWQEGCLVELSYKLEDRFQDLRHGMN